jgi:hypothetical protein
MFVPTTETMSHYILHQCLTLTGELQRYLCEFACGIVSSQVWDASRRLFLACVVKDGRPGFPLVEIGPPLRHMILVIQG